MDKSAVTLTHYTLAIVAVIALVVINIWGHADSALNVALIGVVTTAGWGGIQREQGIKIDSPDKKNPA